MSDAREHAVRLAVIKAVSDRVKGVDTEARREAKSAILPGDRITASLPDGTVIGSVTRSKETKGSEWRVTDAKAFKEWVRKHRPTAIVMTEVVRSSDEASILKSIEDTGLVPDGVEAVPTTTGGVISVRPDYDAVAQLDWRPFVGQPTQQIEGDPR